MKFIIDENISPDVVDLFVKHQLLAIHVNQLKKQKNQKIRDQQLRRLAIHKEWIIVTKDDDFVKSFVSRKVPEKMIFLHNLDNKVTLLERLASLIDKIPSLIEKHDFIEINDTQLNFPFSG